MVPNVTKQTSRTGTKFQRLSKETHIIKMVKVHKRMLPTSHQELPLIPKPA